MTTNGSRSPGRRLPAPRATDPPGPPGPAGRRSQVAFDYFHVANPIPITFPNLEVIVALFSTNPDVTSGLEDKLTAAAASQNQKARDKQLSAFQRQVRAQNGKALTLDQAQFLIQFAQALM